MRSLIFLFLIFVFCIPSFGSSLKLSSWNIRNLSFESIRADSDYSRLRYYASVLDSDIIALQEVSGSSFARRVFPSSQYDFYFSSRDSSQRTGFAVRKGRDISVIHHSDLSALNVDTTKRTDGQRHGTDITIKVDDFELRLLSVHLKSRCWARPLTTPTFDCSVLHRQVPALEDWIDSRFRESVPFAILGDFNRRFDADEQYDPSNSMWHQLSDNDPSGLRLYRSTKGHKSDCWSSRYPTFIDHLIFDDRAFPYIIPDSFSQLVFSEKYSKRAVNALSDHCPISVILDIP